MTYNLVTSNRVELKKTTKKFIGLKSIHRENAESFANENNSYVFPIYQREGKKGWNSSIKLIGFGVPK